MVFAALSVVGPSQAANAKWVLTDDNVNLNLSGVSPDVIKTSKGDRLFRSAMVQTGTAVTICDNSGNCVEETFSTGSTGPVSDVTVAKASSGWRIYFKKTDTTTQGIYSAPCTNENCTSFGSATLTSSQMQVAKETKAWGVPDAVTLPDGRVRIYIVESPAGSGGSCPEKVASYISTDGISFSKESGWRLTGGYVDTEILQTTKNNWLMILADGPGCGGSKGSPKNQQLYISTSKNGLKWTKPQTLTTAAQGRLDPTGYKLTKTSFRIYYASGTMQDQNYVIKRATLKNK